MDQTICVKSHVEMLEALRDCSSEVDKLHGAVGRLSSALDDAAAREAASSVTSDTPSVEPPPPDVLEKWLSDAAARLEQRVEERLGSSLERQVVSAISGPIAELRRAAMEAQQG